MNDPSPDENAAEHSGYAWLERFMEAQGAVAATALFATFKIGQLGVAARGDHELARAMVEDLKTDREDLMSAAQSLDAVLDHIIANVERNLLAAPTSPTSET